GLAHRNEQVAVTACRLAHLLDCALGLILVSFCPDARCSFELPLFRLGIKAMKFDRLLLAFREPIDAYDHALAALDLLLPAKCRLLDLVLHEALLDRDNGPTELVHALDQLPRSGLELIRQGLDEVRAAEGIGRVRGPG